MFCLRGGALLTPSGGDFYVVRVEAFADPSPPVITPEDLEKDHAQVMRDLLAWIVQMSPQETIESIYRRLNFVLCGSATATGLGSPSDKPVRLVIVPRDHRKKQKKIHNGVGDKKGRRLLWAEGEHVGNGDAGDRGGHGRDNKESL